MTAIKKAVEIVGSQSALAEILGVRPQAVQQWVAAGSVSHKRVIAVEKATGGIVSRQELRPDLYPADQFEPQNQDPAA